MYFVHILKFLSLSVKHFPCKTYFVSFEQKKTTYPLHLERVFMEKHFKVQSLFIITGQVKRSVYIMMDFLLKSNGLLDQFLLKIVMEKKSLFDMIQIFKVKRNSIPIQMDVKFSNE